MRGAIGRRGLLLLLLLRRHVADRIGLVQVGVGFGGGGDLDEVMMAAMLRVLVVELVVLVVRRVLQERVLGGRLRQAVLVEAMLDVDV